MSVCQYCNRPLDADYEEIGLCPKCLDNMDDGYDDYDSGERDIDYFTGIPPAEDDY